MSTMASKFRYMLPLFALLRSTVAVPVTSFNNLQCHCINFSPIASPMECSIPDSQGLNWEAARTLASSHNLDIQFASQSTISKVLESDEPLPTSVLLRMSQGMPLPLDYQATSQSADRIVCGIGNEVRAKWLEASNDREGESDVYVGRVVAVLMLLIIGYAAGDAIWARFARNGSQIQLCGDEKQLTADLASEPRSFSEKSDQTEPVSREPSQTDFS